MQVDLARVRGEVVAALLEAVAIGDHRLVRGLEAVERRADLDQGGHAGGAELVGHQHHALDQRVLGRGVERAHDVAQLGFLDRIARDAREGALDRVRRVLLDDRAARRDHQRGLVLEPRHLAGEPRQDRDEQEQCDHPEHQAPHEVERAPDRADQAHEEIGFLDGFGHGSATRCGVGRVGSLARAGPRPMSRRSRRGEGLLDRLGARGLGEILGNAVRAQPA